MKLIKNIQVYVLSGALIFVGVASATQAGAAWSTSEKKTISLLEKRISELEKILSSQNPTGQSTSVTIPYIVESLEEYGTNKICGSGKFRQLDPRGTAAVMTAGNYRLHTCSITLKVNK
jgi:type III secretory pathway component EscV